MNNIEKIIVIIIALVVIIPILLNEIKEYNLKQLKKETIKISEVLKNEYNTITQINIEKNVEIKDGIKTRGEGIAFVNRDSVTVILSYKEYCSVKLPGIKEVALSKSKCQNLKLIDGEIVAIE